MKSNGEPVDPTPENPLRIEGMYAFVVVDPEDNTEGVPTFMSAGYPGIPMPMVGADMEMVDKLRPIAQQLARDTGLKVTLVKFTGRTEVEHYG